MFLKTSFLPTNKVRYAIIDKNAPLQFIENLNKLDITAIFSTKLSNVMQNISTHPDMQIFHIGDNIIICEPSTFYYYNKILTPLGFSVICGSTELSCNYPYDIAYNVNRIGNFIMHKISHTEKKILDYCRQDNISILNTKQGYTKCATCVISENAAITADRGIAKILNSNGIDCLLIKEGMVMLENMNYGFLGGCCGLIDKNLLAFCGKIENHSNYIDIFNFCKKYSVNIISLYDGMLTDIGSIIPIIQA